MNNKTPNLMNRFFKFLGSIKLAVILLVVFAILLSVATVLESKYSTEYVQRVIYKTMWFDLFLFVLGLNVTMSAMSRFPWKKRHTGFVLTHLGIIIILVGSMVTRKTGIEGQIMLQEGQSSSFMRVSEDVLSFRVPQQDTYQEYNPWFIHSGLPDNQELRYKVDGTDITWYVSDYYHNPQSFMTVDNKGIRDNPAIHIALHRPGAVRDELDEWLFADHHNQNTLELNLATIHFHRAQTQEQLDEWLNIPGHDAHDHDDGHDHGTENEIAAEVEVDDELPKGSIQFKNSQGELVHEAEVEAFISQPYTFNNGDEVYAIRFIEFIPRAYVRENQLINMEDKPINPSIKFELTGPFGKEEHLAFAKFPEFGSIHGQNESSSGFIAEFQYPLPETDQSSSQPASQHIHQENLMELIYGPDGAIHYSVTNTAGQLKTGTIAEGESINTGWNNLQLRLSKFYPNARQNQEIVDAPVTSDQQMRNNPAIKYRVEYKGDTQTGFVSFGAQKEVAVAGELCIIEFGQRRYPVGFTLELIDFQAPRYPGTNRPARFQSIVRFIDESKGINEETKIFMNNPLYHNNFAVYQSSYIEGTGGQPDISIFSVARAPGTSTIYVGSIVMCVGMILMFFTKKYSSIRYKQIPEFAETEARIRQ